MYHNAVMTNAFRANRHLTIDDSWGWCIGLVENCCGEGSKCERIRETDGKRRIFREKRVY